MQGGKNLACISTSFTCWSTMKFLASHFFHSFQILEHKCMNQICPVTGLHLLLGMDFKSLSIGRLSTYTQGSLKPPFHGQRCVSLHACQILGGQKHVKECTNLYDILYFNLPFFVSCFYFYTLFCEFNVTSLTSIPAKRGAASR